MSTETTSAKDDAVRRATNRVGVWAMNKVDAKFDLDWGMTALEERELGKIIREEYDALAAENERLREALSYAQTETQNPAIEAVAGAALAQHGAAEAKS